MLSDDIVKEMERHVQACDEARAALNRALSTAEGRGLDSPDDRTAALKPVAAALKDWRDAQRRFMETVERSEAPSVPMAALLLKNDAGVDATNARRGLPGASVEGTDQPFDVDLSGIRGQILTEATDHLSDLDD